MSTIVFESAGVSIAGTGAAGTEQKTILHPFSLTLTEQRIAVIGANGSGKSTLLRLLNGLVLPSTGTVRVNGLNTLTESSAVRRTVGFVFTDPWSQLVMPTPLEDVELSLRRLKLAKSARRRAAEGVLADFGVDHLAHSSIYELSGGERQLTALATVLAVEPSVLVLDEPSTLLDFRNTQLLKDRLAVLPQQVVMSTHDLSLAADFDRVLVIDDGAIAFDGRPNDAVAHYLQLVG
ncbi:ABC-type cobalt transport system, ATPase component [Arthrobacter sp. PAMC 25486]|uniref:energy-coupling factor ABC transporter ATP-binding protein n=1 Tax=Arthrobacter sp. PAMC 25486 TaxID=1494608 RepID=UPI0005361762|nr:ABC transporter ATP-binding protein [Arthrobacter sp. PAMC 25486]AIY03080.1 ABC-type cobalt transport system, ATPase component [Arthrobacter sp. PAMC 25486]